MSRTRAEVQLASWSALTFGSLLTSFMWSGISRDKEAKVLAAFHARSAKKAG